MPDFSPTFIKTDPVTGLTFYDFDGHIHARGIDLDQGTQQSPPEDLKVRWIRQTDGSVTAEIYDTQYNFGGFQFNNLVSNANRHGAAMNWNSLRATDESDASYAQVYAYNNGAGDRGVAAGTGNQTKLVTDVNGKSDFVKRADQLGAAILQGQNFVDQGFDLSEAGTYLILVACTAYVNTANVIGAVGVGIDGFDTECQLAFNIASCHMSMNPAIYTKSLAAGHHVLKSRSDSWVVADSSDRISMSCVRIGN